MKNISKFFAILVLLGLSTTAGAWQIATTPLFLATKIVPIVFFELDDSGSMDWSILSKKYWSPKAYDPDAGDHSNSSTVGASNPITNGNMDSYGSN